MSWSADWQIPRPRIDEASCGPSRSTIAPSRDGVVAFATGRMLVCRVTAIEPGGPPHTRMTVRSNRDDNRASWTEMSDFASHVATTLGGWEVTRP